MLAIYNPRHLRNILRDHLNPINGGESRKLLAKVMLALDAGVAAVALSDEELNVVISAIEENNNG